MSLRPFRFIPQNLADWVRWMNEQDVASSSDASDLLSAFQGSVSGLLVATKTHDFDATDGGTTTVQVTGAAIGDPVLVTAPITTADVNVRGYVSNTDTVTLVKTGIGNPAETTYIVLVFSLS